MAPYFSKKGCQKSKQSAGMRKVILHLKFRKRGIAFIELSPCRTPKQKEQEFAFKQAAKLGINK